MSQSAKYLLLTYAGFLTGALSDGEYLSEVFYSFGHHVAQLDPEVKEVVDYLACLEAVEGSDPFAQPRSGSGPDAMSGP